MGSNNPLKGSSWSNQRADQIEQRKTKVLIFMSFPQKRQKKIKTLSYSNNRKKNKWRRLTRDAIKRLISTKPFMILLRIWGFKWKLVADARSLVGQTKKKRRDFDSLLGGCISLSDDKNALNVDINGENNVDVLER